MKLSKFINFNYYFILLINLNLIFFCSKEESTIIHTSNAPSQNIVLPINVPYGFGNSSLDTPLEKVNNGIEKFTNILKNSENLKSREILIENLMDMLSCNEKFWPDEELKRRAPIWGEHLSRICVKIPESGYGTRTKTVILMDFDNKIDFYENTMITSDPDGEWKETHFSKIL